MCSSGLSWELVCIPGLLLLVSLPRLSINIKWAVVKTPSCLLLKYEIRTYRIINNNSTILYFHEILFYYLFHGIYRTILTTSKIAETIPVHCNFYDATCDVADRLTYHHSRPNYGTKMFVAVTVTLALKIWWWRPHPSQGRWAFCNKVFITRSGCNYALHFRTSF